jgi:hypothetical protein
MWVALRLYNRVVLFASLFYSLMQPCLEEGAGTTGGLGIERAWVDPARFHPFPFDFCRRGGLNTLSIYLYRRVAY